MSTKQQTKQSETAVQTESVAKQFPALIKKAESLTSEIAELGGQVESKRQELAKAQEDIQNLMNQHPDIFGTAQPTEPEPAPAPQKKKASGTSSKARSQDEWKEAIAEIEALEKEHGDFNKAVEAFNAKYKDKPVKPATVKAWQKKLTSK